MVNRGLSNLYRKIKRLFVADKPIHLHRECKKKEAMLEQYPEVNNEINQKQSSNIDTAQQQNTRSCRQQNHR